MTDKGFGQKLEMEESTQIPFNYVKIRDIVKRYTPDLEMAVRNLDIKKDGAVDEISDIWMKTQQDAVGPYIKLDNDYRSLWAYIPHFVHTPFYVYAYAFGDCLVNALWNEYQNSDKSKFANQYIDLLAAGGTKRHDELLKPFSLSAHDNNFWAKGVNSITNMIDELETL